MDLNDIFNLLGANEDNLHPLDPKRFKDFIDKYDMKCKYSIAEKNGETVIIEDWSSSKNKMIRVNRIYPFSMEHLDLIQDDARKGVLQELLEMCVSEENYETAAELRDVINTL